MASRHAPPVKGFKRTPPKAKTPKITNGDVRQLGKVSAGKLESSIDPNKMHRHG